MPDNTPGTESPKDTNLFELWAMLWRGRWTILTLFVVVVTLVTIGTFTQKPLYRASATVEITPQARKVAPVADVADLGTGGFGWYAEERYYNTQYEIIKSRDVARRVFDRLDLQNHPRFRKSTDSIGAFTRMVQIDPIKDTGIVRISLEGPNPEEVAAWVNALAEAYVQRNLDEAIQATGRAVKGLLRELAPLRERMEGSQRETFEFAEKANLFVPENQEKMANEKLSTLETQLTEAQVKRSQVESLLKRIEQLRRDETSYETVPAIANDPVIQSLLKEKVALEREYERLLVTYRDKHVRVLEKKSEIDNLGQKVAAEGDRIISRLRVELALMRDQEERLVKASTETKSESLRASQQASTFEIVKGEATGAKRIYELLNTRLKEINLSPNLLNNNLRILDSAPVPRVPVRPRKLLNLAIGAFLGLLLGVGVVLFLDYINNTVRTTEDVEHYLKLNLLAIVPKQTEETERAVQEAYQSLRTSLLFSRKAHSSKVVLVTSAGPQEGKSSTVVHIAGTLAKAGEKVIVVDCDQRRPALHQRFGVQRDRGLTNYILASDGQDWRNYVTATSEANLSVVTSGPLPPNPADVFGHERFHQLLKELREHFDWVFIDSPPIMGLADALILASISDMVALVVRHNQGDKEMIRRCIANIRKVNPNVIGAVLNCVDLDRAHYKDYYYAGYYYYGESSSAVKKRKSQASPTESPADADSRGRFGSWAG